MIKKRINGRFAWFWIDSEIPGLGYPTICFARTRPAVGQLVPDGWAQSPDMQGRRHGDWWVAARKVAKNLFEMYRNGEMSEKDSKPENEK